MRNTNLKVRTITNDERADRLRKTLEADRHVRSASVQMGEPASVTVEYDESSITPEHLVAELRRAGFDAEIGGKSAGGAP